MNFKELLKLAINASVKGGHAIMEVYSSDFAVEYLGMFVNGSHIVGESIGFLRDIKHFLNSS